MLSAPTSDELLNNPIVRQALDQAWADSLPNDPVRRHEEGGWIYLDVSSGIVTVRRASSGGKDAIDLDLPPVVLMSVVVAIFHTHPNPSDEGWFPGASPVDDEFDSQHGVPDFIVSDQGTIVNGRSSGRGGLSGPAGFPL